MGVGEWSRGWIGVNVLMGVDDVERDKIFDCVVERVGDGEREGVGRGYFFEWGKSGEWG